MTPFRPAGPAVTKLMLAEARAEVVWVNATAPEDFYDDPNVVRLIWQLGDAAAELRGRLAQRRVETLETPSAQLFDQDEL